MTNSPWTPERDAELRHRASVDAYKSWGAIADDMGLSIDTVRRRVAILGIVKPMASAQWAKQGRRERKPPPVSPEKARRAREQAAERMAAMRFCDCPLATAANRGRAPAWMMRVQGGQPLTASSAATAMMSA